MEENPTQAGLAKGPAYGDGPDEASAAATLLEAKRPLDAPLDRVVERARGMVDETTDLINAQPYTSVILATLAGLALGLLMGSGRREVIYLRQ
ncbi:MAG: hypothetical protein ACYC8V_08960 [Caulobacteraceae bacterium]